MDQNELRRMLVQKVDKGELEAVVDLKSNKTDTDVAMKCVDIMHQ